MNKWLHVAAVLQVVSFGYFWCSPLGVQPNIISNLPSASFIASSVKCAIALTLLLSAPLSLAPALNLIEAM